jgi:hypothetical protein
MNQDNQNTFNFQTKKAMLHFLYKQGQLSFVEFYDALLSLFEAHHIHYAK